MQDPTFISPTDAEKIRHQGFRLGLVSSKQSHIANLNVFEFARSNRNTRLICTSLDALPSGSDHMLTGP